MNKKYYWLIPLILFSIISLIGDSINGKFDLVDFEVYYRTANRMLSSDAIYRIESDGHFVYKYSPVAVLYFIPFALFKYSIAKYLYWILMTIALAWGLSLLLDLVGSNKEYKRINVVLLGSVLALVPHIHLEWHLGQVNILLIVLYIYVIRLYLDKKDKPLGFLLGLSIFLKPFALIFLPYFLIKKRFEIIASLLISSMLFALIPFVFYPSWDSFSGLYVAWINELQIEMGNKQDLLAAANHTIFSVLARYTPIQYLLTSTVLQKAYQLCILGLMGVSFLKYMQWGKNQNETQMSVGEIALLAAWIPLIAFTSQNAFIYSLALIAYLLFNFERLPMWSKTVLVIGCIGMGINMYDLVGKSMHVYLMQISIYTFASFAFSIVAFDLRRRYK